MSFLINPYMVKAPIPEQCGLYNLETYSTDDGLNGSYNGFHNITETGKKVNQVKMQLYRNGSPGTNVIALKIWESSVVSSTDNTDGYTYNDLGTSIENRTVVTFDDLDYTLTDDTRLVIVPQYAGATMPRTGILSQAIGSFKLTVSYNSGSSWTDSASWDILGCITQG